jgi:beta-phosphoglucomutase
MVFPGNITMKIETILFDYDGVVAQTPPLNHRGWQLAFGKYGKVVSSEEYFLLEGHGPRKIADILCERHGVDPGMADSIRSDKERYMHELGLAPVYPEIPPMLAWLKDRGIALGLVTGASKSRIDAALKDLYEFFGVVITSDHVARTKPHPEPYLKGVELLGGKQSTTLAIENAPLGIVSAKAAGLTCWALTTTLPGSCLQEADWVFDQHQALRGKLAGLLDPGSP